MISFRSKITQNVLSYFLLNPESEMYVNEIAKKFSVDRGNLIKKLAEWEKENILLKSKKGNLSIYKVNKKYPFFKELQRIFQKSFGIEYQLKQVFKKIKGIKQAIIFGSYAKNQLNAESDIDLLLVGSHNFLNTQKEIAKLQKKIDREINIIDFTEQEFNKSRKNALLKNIFNNKFIKII